MSHKPKVAAANMWRANYRCERCGFKSFVDVKPEITPEQLQTVAELNHDMKRPGVCAGFKPRWAEFDLFRGQGV